MALLLLLAFGIGVVAGLRSMTAPAALSWAAYLGWLQFGDAPLRFLESPVTVAIFSLLAVGELIADKLPFTPKRTAPAPLIVRMISGGFCGFCLCWLALGVAFGAVGAIVGAFAGYFIRKALVSQLRIRDLYVALLEDFVAIGLAFFLAHGNVIFT